MQRKSPRRIFQKRSVIPLTVKRGEIYYADLSPVVGSEQGGVRPVLIVQNDVGNKFSPTVIAAAITSQKDKSRLPTHIALSAEHCGLSKDSVVLLEQIRTIDKRRLKERMGKLDLSSMRSVDRALGVSFGLSLPFAPAVHGGGMAPPAAAAVRQPDSAAAMAGQPAAQSAVT